MSQIQTQPDRQTGLHVRAELARDEGGLYSRAHYRYVVYEGERLLASHLSRRAANRHAQGRPVMVSGFRWGRGFRYEVWQGARVTEFTERADAEAFLASLSTQKKAA